MKFSTAAVRHAERQNTVISSIGEGIFMCAGGQNVCFRSGTVLGKGETVPTVCTLWDIFTQNCAFTNPESGQWGRGLIAAGGKSKQEAREISQRKGG